MAQSYVTIAMRSSKDANKDQRVVYFNYIAYLLHNNLETNLIIPLKHIKILVLIKI